MAAPAVAGCVALVMAEAAKRGKTLANSDVRSLVIGTARQNPPASGGWDSRYGHGRIAPATMVAQVAAANPVAPPPAPAKKVAPPAPPAKKVTPPPPPAKKVAPPAKKVTPPRKRGRGSVPAKKTSSSSRSGELAAWIGSGRRRPASRALSVPVTKPSTKSAPPPMAPKAAAKAAAKKSGAKSAPAKKPAAKGAGKNVPPAAAGRVVRFKPGKALRDGVR
jgi:hypothetical protein